MAALFVMQSFAISLCSQPCVSAIWKCTHIDNFHCATPDPVTHETVIHQLSRHLTVAGIRISPAITCITPPRVIQILLFRLDASSSLISRLFSRVTETDRLLATWYSKPFSPGLLSLYLSRYTYNFCVPQPL